MPVKRAGYVRPCLQIPEYVAWQSMWARVRYPENPKYKKTYIDRGITVCDRWKDPKNFLEDMGKKPTPEHTLDRIDSNKPYSPENCRWATRQEQQRNRSCTRWIEFNGERLPLIEWANRIGITGSTMSGRLKRMTVERALTMAKQL